MHVQELRVNYNKRSSPLEELAFREKSVKVRNKSLQALATDIQNGTAPDDMNDVLKEEKHLKTQDISQCLK